MPAQQYRKKPVVITAVQWNGADESLADIIEHMEGATWGINANRIELFILTLEGEMTASPGDWIIKGVQGEHYPCKPDIFEQTYEAV